MNISLSTELQLKFKKENTHFVWFLSTNIRKQARRVCINDAPIMCLWSYLRKLSQK